MENDRSQLRQTRSSWQTKLIDRQKQIEKETVKEKVIMCMKMCKVLLPQFAPEKTLTGHYSIHFHMRHHSQRVCNESLC